jgi:SAM-dependent methyltransferase
MLDELRIAVPEADAIEAPAELIPLADESCDAVFAAQCFHWFDRERALPELQRVLKPGGGLVLVWNWYDERSPLQVALGPIVGYAGNSPYREPELPGPPWFAEIGRTVVESVDESSPEQLVGMFATTSTYLTADPVEGEEWLASIRENAEPYGSSFPFPKLTYAFAYRRL